MSNYQTLKDNRIPWIDFAKGVGIILVILGHVITNDRFSLYLHAFHMPFFFIISGYLTSKSSRRTALQYIKGKARSLLIPYVVFGIFTYFVWLLRYSKELTAGTAGEWWSPLHHLLWINSTGLKISGEFWFLSALFFASILFYFLKRMIKKNYIRLIVILPVILFGCLFRKLFDIQLPWSMLSAFVGVGFMFIGFLLRNKDNKLIVHLLNLRFYEIIVILVGVCFLINLNGEINMRRSLYSNVFLFYLNAVSVSIVIFNICRKLCNSTMLSRVRSIIENIGKDSITYVCLDSMVIKLISAVTRKFISLPTGFVGTLGEFVLATVTIIILYWLNKLIYKLRITFIIGK